MKVNDPNLNGANLGSTGLGRTGLDRTQAADRTRSGAYGNQIAPDGTGDRVQLSNLSSAIAAQAGDSPERLARVEQLRSEVASGEYQVDAQAVSSRMLDDALSSSGGSETSGE